MVKRFTMDSNSNNSAPELKTSLISNTGEVLFALFLSAAYLKADTRLAFVQTHIDITLLFFGLSFLAFIYRVIENNYHPRVSRDFICVAFLFFLLGACLAAGLLQTQSPQYGYVKALRFISVTGWAFLGGVLLITDVQSLKRFSMALAIIALAMAIDALLGYQSALLLDIEPAAFGSDHIALGRACGLGLLTIIAFLLPTERELWLRFGLWIVASLQLLTTFISQAMGPISSLVLSFLFFFAISVRGWPRIRIDRFALRLFVVTLFATIIIVLVLLQGIFPSLTYDMQNYLTGGDRNVVERLSYYQTAYRQFSENPIWGIGTGEFKLVTEDYAYDYPHNIILELAAETGLLSVLVFITMIGIIFGRGLFYLYASNGLDRIVSRYLLAACCFTLLNAMVSYDINGNMILFTFVGLLTALTRFQMPGAKEA